MTAAVLGAGVSQANTVRVGASVLTPFRTFRPIVLAAIIGLHVGVLIYATLLKPTVVRPPEVAPVAMMQLLATPSLTASVQASVPVPEIRPTPKPRAEPTPPKPKVVKTPPKPLPKPVVKTVTEPRPVSIPVPAESVSTPKPAEQVQSAPSGQSGSSSSAETQTAAAAPAAKPAETASPPSFSAAYLNNPPPVYPPMARRMGEEGKVMLRVYVTPQGTAGEVKIHTSSGSTMFDDAAQAAVKGWRFVPARQGENPIAAWVQVPIVFKLS